MFPVNLTVLVSQVSPTHHHTAGSGEQRQHAHTALSSPPRGTVTLRYDGLMLRNGEIAKGEQTVTHWKTSSRGFLSSNQLRALVVCKIDSCNHCPGLTSVG